MNVKKLLVGAALFAALIMVHHAQGITIDPAYDYFGSLPQATFGGTGIPNNAVAVNLVESGIYDITLGLTATGRYANPTPENDGAGTFYAMRGGDSPSTYAKWNIGYYVNIVPDNLTYLNPKGYSVRLYYDKNPSIGSDVSTYVPMEPQFINGWTFNSEDSWNSGMDWPFTAGSFNPNFEGEYDFTLMILKNGIELGRSSISVIVNETGQAPSTNVPDGGMSLAMLGFASVGLLVVKRKRS